jgi:oligosaccharide 4-alpha-D-glucosyltransferase
MKTKLSFLLFFNIISFLSYAQLLNVTPTNPGVDSSIVLVFDASQGNGELAGYTGDVYMHTGVITIESSHPGDWKYVKTNWCENTTETKMTPLGNDLYQAEFHIRGFYGIPEDEIVLQLAFLFRSEDCSLVGRDTENQDIFYPLSFQISNSSYESHVLQNDSLIINCDEGNIVITAYNSNIINVFSAAAGELNQESYSVIGEKETVSFNFLEDDKYLKFRTDTLELVIDTTDLSFEFVYENDTILRFPKIYNFGDQGVLISELSEDERIYGTGSRAIDSDRRGRSLAVNNQAQYGYGAGAENLNITLPVLNSSKYYSLFFDNHSIANLDIGSVQDNLLQYSFTSGQADLFVIAGKDHGSLVNNFSYLTGYQPMPPIWSLGYIQSKYGYENESAAYSIVNEILNADFPMDALVLDLYWFGDPGTMGNLDWDNSRFPNPETMMTDFLDLGVKTILITEPYFTLASSNYSFADANSYFGENESGDTYVLYGFWTGDAALLDLFHPDVPEWFNQFYIDRTNEGVEGWWTDLGEPESHPWDMYHYGGIPSTEIHNVYALEWEKIVYENWQTHFPEKRLFNLSRSGFAGMQRYSTFPWSGDIQRSFDGLRVQVPIMLSMGLNGIPYMHSDVGGFTGGGNDDELFIRWVQMGVFAPIFRIHGTGIETSPTAYGTNAQDITRKYIKLRYELLPYTYTLAYEASTKGLPLARPMDFYEPENQALQNLNDQYFWGEHLLIAPVLNQGQTQRDVILPEGKWLNYFDLTEYSGPGTFTMSSPLEDIPVLLKAGSFIPTARNLSNTDNYSADTLYIQYFPDADQNESQYTFFDDDKQSPNSLDNNEYCLIHLNGLYTEEEIRIDLATNDQSYSEMPVSRQLIFEIFRINESPDTVSYDETGLTEYYSLNDLEDQSSGYFFHTDNDILYVSIPYMHDVNTLKIGADQLSKIEYNEDLLSDYSVYPNPGSDYLIVSGNKSKKRNIQVYDAAGKLLKSLLIDQSKDIVIHTADFTKGIYYIHITDMKSTHVSKWIKN